jgi:hypothetical protein
MEAAGMSRDDGPFGIMLLRRRRQPIWPMEFGCDWT